MIMIDGIVQAKIYDDNASYYGYPLEKLMENAGKAVAEVLLERYGENKRIAFICGPGNNGGDGLVAARRLQSKAWVVVFMIPAANQVKSELTKKNWDRYQGEKYENIHSQDIKGKFDIIVECLFGTGIKGELKEPYRSIVLRLNSLQGKKVSIDLPTQGYKEDIIISLMTQKHPEAIVVDIGYPQWLKKKIGVGEVKALYKPGSTSHKGENGKVLVVGGSETYHGALLLSSKVAGKVVDLVYASSVPENNRLIHKMKFSLFEFIAIPRNQVKETIKDMDSVLIGPGMGASLENKDFIHKILKANKSKKIILDADALKVIDPKFLNKNCLVTPHKREFKKLFKVKPSSANLKKMSKKYGCVIVLKGKPDYVVYGEEVKVNENGNAGMTKGGTGDVLAGLITALAARNDLFLAARAGVFINGLAADRLFSKSSYYYSAGDLVEEIPVTIKAC